MPNGDMKWEELNLWSFANFHQILKVCLS